MLTPLLTIEHAPLLFGRDTTPGLVAFDLAEGGRAIRLYRRSALCGRVRFPRPPPPGARHGGEDDRGSRFPGRRAARRPDQRRRPPRLAGLPPGRARGPARRAGAARGVLPPRSRARPGRDL